jgi:ketosteroid isomerase-like protein
MTDSSTTSTTSNSFDATALRRGIEHRDAAALLPLYAPDATIEITDAAHGPSTPLRLAGREEIAGHLEDVYGRDMEHRVELTVADGDALGYTVRCAYPDGTLVRCASMARLRDGRIVSETIVQAWDA